MILTSSKDSSGFVKLDNVPLEETWRAMEDCMNGGMTRALGVANFTLNQLQQLYSFAKIKPAVAQFEVHPYLLQRDILDFCNRHGIIGREHIPSCTSSFTIYKLTFDISRLSHASWIIRRLQ